MNVDHVEAFLYVVHFKNVHRAAEALFLSQPSVTARIKSLEKELNVDLFVRKGRGIQLSKKGEEFVPFAEQLLKTYQLGKRKMQKSAAKHGMTIGANDIVTRFFLPDLIVDWKSHFLDDRFKTVSSTNEEILAGVLDKEIDIAFVRGVTHPAVETHTVLRNRIQLALSNDHVLNQKTTIKIEDLEKEPMVFFECGAFDWGRIHKMFEVHSIQPRIDYHVDDLDIAKSLIASGAGVGFLPELCLLQDVDKGIVNLIDVSHIIQIEHQIQLAYLPEVVAPDLVKKVIESATRFEQKFSTATL